MYTSSTDSHPAPARSDAQNETPLMLNKSYFSFQQPITHVSIFIQFLPIPKIVLLKGPYSWRLPACLVEILRLPKSSRSSDSVLGAEQLR